MQILFIRKEKILLSLILVIGLIFRLYKINTPLADWHSFRQADTASVTREYLKNGINLLEPKYHDLSNIQSGLDNLEGYRMVEFPFINALVAVLIRVFPFLPLVITSRLVSIGFSLGTILSIFYLLKQIANPKLAALTAFLMAVMPYSVFYSRAILPESPMLFFSSFSILAFFNYLNQQKKTWAWFLLSVLSLSLALLLKPFVVFLAPVYLVLWLQKDGKKFYRRWPIFFVAFSFLPFLWWREWIEKFPSGIPASDWLFNSNRIRLRPAWFRWLFYHRLTQLITGYGTLIMPLAFLQKWKKATWMMLSWWLGLLAYLIVIATGNVQHDYYQVLLIPIIMMTLAEASLIFYQLFNLKFGQRVAIISVSLLITIFWWLSFNQVKGYFNINHWEYVKAGQRVDQVLPSDSKVIAPAMGDTIFLFQTNRTGWPIGFEIEEKISKGAEYYIGTSFDDETNMLMEKYEIIEKTDDYVIIDLKAPVTSGQESGSSNIE